MFTGIVEELGRVVALDQLADSAVLTVSASVVTGDAGLGDSIAVNGVCLTVTACSADQFRVDVMRQTLDLTALRGLAPGDPVNLERAMPAAGRFGGHVVQGHVDGVARIVRREPGDRWDVVTLELPDHLARYVVAQGSITLDGVSLTVACLGDDTFAVSLIPATLAMTTLGHKQAGDQVNVEVDVLAKYVERLITTAPSEGLHP